MQVNLFALFLGNITGTASVYLREIITTPSFSSETNGFLQFFYGKRLLVNGYNTSGIHFAYDTDLCIFPAFDQFFQTIYRFLAFSNICLRFHFGTKKFGSARIFRYINSFCAATSSNCFSPVVIFLITSPFSSMVLQIRQFLPHLRTDSDMHLCLYFRGISDYIHIHSTDCVGISANDTSLFPVT